MPKNVIGANTADVKKYNLVNSEWVKFYSERWSDLKIVELTPIDLAKIQMAEIEKAGTLNDWYKHCIRYRKRLKTERIA